MRFAIYKYNDIFGSSNLSIERMPAIDKGTACVKEIQYFVYLISQEKHLNIREKHSPGVLHLLHQNCKYVASNTQQ